MSKEYTEFSEEELLNEIEQTSGRMGTDIVRLKRPLSEEDESNSKYWLEKRKPKLLALCEEFIRRNKS
jgi:hypothetical protein